MKQNILSLIIVLAWSALIHSQVGPGLQIKMSSSVTALLGSRSELPCDISAPFTGDDVLFVIWYKFGSVVPFFTFDVRKNLSKFGNSKNNLKDLSTRSSFVKPPPSPAKLIIDKVKSEDGGSYICRVDLEKSPTQYTRINLTVIIQPEKPQLYDVNKNRLGSVSKGHLLGGTLILYCETNSGDPLPILTWWMGNQLLDDSYHTFNDSSVINQLNISMLKREHHNMVLECQASNNNHSLPVASWVTIHMILTPESVQIVSPGSHLVASNKYLIQCVCNGSVPPADMFWTLGDMQLPENMSKTHFDEQMTYSYLELIPSRTDDLSSLTCHATNSLIPTSIVSDSLLLDVHYIPVVTTRIGSGLELAKIKEGDDVYFECFVKSNPKIFNLRWQLNGKTILNNDSAGILLANTSLVLQKIRRQSSGGFRCVATNSIGEGRSLPIKLNVKYPPHCDGPVVKTIGVSLNEKKNISCFVEAHPAELTFHWAVNSSRGLVHLTEDRISQKGQMSFITFEANTKRDYTTLLCWARNNVGDQQIKCQIIIEETAIPEPVRNCVVKNITQTSAWAHCDIGFDGGLQQHFNAEVYDTRIGIWLQNLSGSTPNFHFSELPPDRLLVIKIASVNEKGQSEPEALSFRTESYKEHISVSVSEQKTELHPSQDNYLAIILALVIGVVTTLFLFSLCALVVISYRKRQVEKRLAHASGRQCGSDLTIMTKSMNSESNLINDQSPDVVRHETVIFPVLHRLHDETGVSRIPLSTYDPKLAHDPEQIQESYITEIRKVIICDDMRLDPLVLDGHDFQEGSPEVNKSQTDVLFVPKITPTPL